MKIGPAYSIMKTVSQEIWGPGVQRTVSGCAERRGVGKRTKVFDEDFFPCHDLLLLADERLSVLQDDLLLRVKDSQAVGILAAGLLGKYFLDILYGSLVCDLDVRGQFLDWLLRCCGVFVSL
jgi:hypothetical protein